MPKPVLGQHSSTKGLFTINHVKGCVGMTVSVTTKAGYEAQYWYSGFNASVSGDKTYTHTYTKAGKYSVVFLGGLTSRSKRDQTDSIQIEVMEAKLPEFKVYNCDAHRVRVQITSSYYNNYKVDFTSSRSESVTPNAFSRTFTYKAGTHQLVVSGQFSGADHTHCGTASKTITTIAAIQKPELRSIETTQQALAGTLQLTHSLGKHTVYDLERSEGGTQNFQKIAEVSGAVTQQKGINTNSQFYCYRIHTLDACQNKTFRSGTLCSVYVGVSAQKSGNTLTWQTDATQATAYQIIRNNKRLARLTGLSTTSYEDKDVVCNKKYTYQLQPLFPQGNAVSVDTSALAKKVEVLPKKIDYPFSTIRDQKVVLTWRKPNFGDLPFKEYMIERNVGRRVWKSYAKTQDTTYTDARINFAVPHAYRIKYSDACGNVSLPSTTTAPIIARQGKHNGTQVSYTWSLYQAWLNGIKRYTIEQVDESSGVLATFPVLSGRESTVTFSLNNSEDKYIRVKAESLGPTPVFTYSNTLTTQLRLALYLPNAFTPDDDGVNDLFVAKGPRVHDFKMEIYDRWGGLLLRTTDRVNGWNGKLGGQQATEGTYVYKIFFKDAERRSYQQVGSVLLMRRK